MYKLRQWTIKHSGFVEAFYKKFEWLLSFCRPLFDAIGYDHLQKPMAALEKSTKTLLFDCHMCGECVLNKTGMSCPMNCPKKVRNGPCGGVRKNGHCEVKPDMRCVWVDGWSGIQKMKAGTLTNDLNPATDHNQQGKSTWLKSVQKVEVDANQIDVAQAEPVSSGSGLETVLKSGAFAVTSEIAPPDSVSLDSVYKHVEYFAGNVDALNVIDSAGGNCHMSSIAVSSLLVREGCEPIMQMTCRDRNRIAIQGDVIGAAALGVKNVLCLTGDDVSCGDDPGAKPVFDLDGISLLDNLKTMRDKQMFHSGRRLDIPPSLFLGAVANPFAPPLNMRPLRLAKKVAAGAQFIQTQYCFDALLLKRYMNEVRDLGLDKKCYILVGVGPISSAKTALWLRNKVPGITIPDTLIERLSAASDPRQEGVKICIELIEEIREIEGVSGVHIMAPRQEHLVPEIIASSGILEGRQTNIPSTVKKDTELCLSQA